MKLAIETVTVNKHAPRGGPGRRGPRREPAVVYFWPKGETLMENLDNRRRRPFNEYRKLKDEVVSAVTATGGLEAWQLTGLRDSKWRWSQRAGCSCGCSPGFVIDGYRGFDVHANVMMHPDA